MPNLKILSLAITFLASCVSLEGVDSQHDQLAVGDYEQELSGQSYQDGPEEMQEPKDNDGFSAYAIYSGTLRAQPVSGQTRFHNVTYAQPHNTYNVGDSLRDWLAADFRSMEIDVIGASSPYSWPYVGHDGTNEVSNCIPGARGVRLYSCLQVLRQWVDSNPYDWPIMLLVDLKDRGPSWNAERIGRLDQNISTYLGSRMYRYRDLQSYTGYYAGGPSMRSRTSSVGWPTMDQMRGKIVVAFSGGETNYKNQNMASAHEWIESYYGRSPNVFMCPEVDDEPEEVQVGGALDGLSASRSQYFVCSNLRSRDHYQVTANAAYHAKQIQHLWGNHVFNNNSYEYNYIALAHGASIIGRDISTTSGSHDFNGNIPLVSVRRSLPGYFKLRPTDSTGMCMDVHGYSNGSNVHQYPCNSGYDKQYVYTAEGQLRPRGNNRYCVDIDGGDAGNGKKLHLWDCDGGRSEKWVIQSNTQFRNVDDSRAYCLDADVPTGTGVRWQTWSCGGWDEQRFWLESVADWPQPRSTW